MKDCKKWCEIVLSCHLSTLSLFLKTNRTSLFQFIERYLPISETILSNFAPSGCYKIRRQRNIREFLWSISREVSNHILLNMFVPEAGNLKHPLGFIEEQMSSCREEKHLENSCNQETLQ